MSTLIEGTNDVGPQGRPTSESLPSNKAAGGRPRGWAVDTRRLKVIGVVLPIVFVLTLELIRFRVVGKNIGDYDIHIYLAVFTVVAVVAFSFIMFHFIDRAQIETAELVTDLRRRQREGHGFYDVLLRISNQNALADILAAVAGHARGLLECDDAVVCLNDATTRAVPLEWASSGAAAPKEGVCISPDSDGSHVLHDLRVVCPVRSSTEFKQDLQIPIQSREIMLGELWIGRMSSVPFTERDRQFLATLSDLASIAVTSARMRESERQGAVLAERERIARELHDSLAQALGVTHLRLRVLGAREDVQVAPATATELIELADVCEEAYRDVREAILDLREASRTDRSLLDGLRAYLEKYSHQCGIETSLEATPGHDLVLPPRSEIQVIRVIQEALTNVRKHSGATSAVVRIAQADGTATFIVEDDGRGFNQTDTLLDRDGFGLHSMRERMELIGGSLLIDSAPGRGTRIVAKVPNIPPASAIPVELDDAIT